VQASGSEELLEGELGDDPAVDEAQGGGVRSGTRRGVVDGGPVPPAPRRRPQDPFAQDLDGHLGARPPEEGHRGDRLACLAHQGERAVGVGVEVGEGPGLADGPVGRVPGGGGHQRMGEGGTGAGSADIQELGLGGGGEPEGGRPADQAAPLAPRRSGLGPDQRGVGDRVDPDRPEFAAAHRRRRRGGRLDPPWQGTASRPTPRP